jgi:ABC-type lipoprotein export system ATPase subunit
MATTSTTWNARGSEWNRWDPHIHAPGTVLNDQFGGDWAAYLKAIDESTPSIRSLGITDYCTIQTYREVRRWKEAGKLPKIQLVFPNVEMRFDVGTAKGKGINLHLLFSPEKVDHENEIERILGQLSFESRGRTFHCTRTDLVALGKMFNPDIKDEEPAFAEGVNQFKVRFPELRELFRREVWLRENCLVAVAAAQADGLSGLQDDGGFTLLREEMQRFAHVIFSGKLCDREFWLGKNVGADRDTIEAKYGTLKPCLHGCDAHDLAKVGTPDLSRYCWIKGDFSFESLRQAVIEPEERVWIGEQSPLPPADSVTIDTIRPLETPWLKNNTITLSRGLVAVIGARGSGKTALVDLIASGAEALKHPLAESSFLKRATDVKDLIGPAKVEEHWRDGTMHVVDFRPPNAFAEETLSPAVCYLSQQFVERLCSSGGLASELRREIERVIFDQTDPTERYGSDSFQSLTGILLDPVRHRRQQQIDSVVATSDRIADEERLRDQLSKLRSDRVTLDSNLKKQRKELEDLLPKGKEARTKRLLELEAACTESEGKIDGLRRRNKALDDLLAEANHVRDQLEPARFADMQERFADSMLSVVQWEAFRQKFSGDVPGIVTAAKQAAAKETKRLQQGDLQNPIDQSTAPLKEWPLIALRAERDKVKKEVGVDAERQTKYDVLKRAITANEAALRKLDVGIKNAEGANERLKALRQARRDAYRDLFDSFVEEENFLAKLYEPLHQQLEGAEGALAKLRFVVKRQVRLEEWVRAGEELLDLRVDTCFRGHGALSKAAVKSLLPAWRTGDSEAVATAMHEFVKQVFDDVHRAMPASIAPDKKIDWLKQVGNWLYDPAHISIEYGLEYDGIAVEQLSPGMRGIVLLLLYLVIDRNDRRPLLIDQPEENLDPRSVFRDLVPHFREARRRRQVIIVTHNANLVVNTDADQVIVASATPTPGGGLPTIAYESGSLENPAIRHAVCDILEGGKRAFLERERRYRLQWEQMLDGGEFLLSPK